MATKFGVDRSTICKILKRKSEWLAVGEHDEHQFVRGRVMFPDVEALLQPWLDNNQVSGDRISDKEIILKAKEAAQSLGIGEDRFKASNGWVMHYKRRHGIQKGVCGREQTNPKTTSSSLQIRYDRTQNRYFEERNNNAHLHTQYTGTEKTNEARREDDLPAEATKVVRSFFTISY
ncbi:hypothetical protein SCHPADRAFT_948282 [Schizopora paradoxa]|uniref:HTH CENPB-type domain-containing protein n=1 Tax=Schizopora paradoxa TaxID=27342 RepID=A0A0H2R2W6_9AGAM|nr:hypothetical protein SCHPADRAFT_948282 [Schizopora paradoxa]